MKFVHLIVLSFIFVISCFLNNSTAQWVQVNNGIGNKFVYSLTNNGNYLFAGTENYGLYLSTNNGTSWTQTSINNLTVHSLVGNGSNVFAGTAGNGVYLSTNNGSNWHQTSLNNKTVYSLAINSDNIFAGTYLGNGIFSSINNGTSWYPSLNSSIIYAFVCSGNNIFAGTEYGVYLTTNYGTSWTHTTLNGQFVYSLAISGYNLFAGTYYGVLLSNNSGISWTQTSLNSQHVWSLAENGNNVFAGTETGFYSSNDIGMNWTQRNEGLPSNAALLTLSLFNNSIFAGTNGYGVYRRQLSELIGIQPISNEIPSQFQLEQNYPNPFNPTTKIKFAIPSGVNGKSSMVNITIFDILGKEVTTLVNEQLQPGTYETEWNATNYPSGVYYYKLAAGDFTETKKMVLVK